MNVFLSSKRKKRRKKENDVYQEQENERESNEKRSVTFHININEFGFKFGVSNNIIV